MLPSCFAARPQTIFSNIFFTPAGVWDRRRFNAICKVIFQLAQNIFRHGVERFPDVRQIHKPAGNCQHEPDVVLTASACPPVPVICRNSVAR